MFHFGIRLVVLLMVAAVEVSVQIVVYSLFKNGFHVLCVEIHWKWDFVNIAMELGKIYITQEVTEIVLIVEGWRSVPLVGAMEDITRLGIGDIVPFKFFRSRDGFLIRLNQGTLVRSRRIVTNQRAIPWFTLIYYDVISLQ